MKENQSKVIKKSKRVWIIEGKKGTTCLVRSSNWYVRAKSEQYVYFDNTIGRNASVTVYVGEKISVAQQLIQYDSTSA